MQILREQKFGVCIFYQTDYAILLLSQYELVKFFLRDYCSVGIDN